MFSGGDISTQPIPEKPKKVDVPKKEESVKKPLPSIAAPPKKEKEKEEKKKEKPEIKPLPPMPAKKETVAKKPPAKKDDDMAFGDSGSDDEISFLPKKTNAGKPLP